MSVQEERVRQALELVESQEWRNRRHPSQIEKILAAEVRRLQNQQEKA